MAGITLGIVLFTVLTLLICGCLLLAAHNSGKQNKMVRHDLKKCRELFHRRREWLEADFITAASKSGKPRGLAWRDCEFDDEVTFARDRSNGQLRALVATTISFTAIEGGGMEEVEAVGNLRCATAVFHFVDNEWSTDGRVIFNLDPAETINHFQHELELA